MITIDSIDLVARRHFCHMAPSIAAVLVIEPPRPAPSGLSLMDVYDKACTISSTEKLWTPKLPKDSTHRPFWRDVPKRRRR